MRYFLILLGILSICASIGADEQDLADENFWLEDFLEPQELQKRLEYAKKFEADRKIYQQKQHAESQQSQLEPNHSSDELEEHQPTEQESQAEEMLWEEIVVTPSSEAKENFEESYIAHSFSKENLQNKRLIRSVPEALKETPGVTVQKTAHGQGSPFIRGFTGFRTVFLIDGIRLNNSVFREGPNQYWNTVDFFNIQTLEVVKGPGSVLYGSDAIGGVLHTITREREKYSETSQINTRLYYRFSTAENSHIGRVEVEGNIGEDVGFLAGFQYKDFGDLHAGGSTGNQQKTGYQELGGDLKVNFKISKDAELVLGYFLVDQDDAERTHKTIFAESFQGTDVGDELQRTLFQDRQLAYGQLRLYNVSEIIDRAIFTVSWHYQEEVQDRIRANLRQDVQGFIVNTLGVQAKFESYTEFGTFIYGADYYRDFVNSFRQDFNEDGTLRANRIQGPIADNSTYDLLGAFLQYEYTFGDYLTIIPSVRYTHAWVDADQIEDPITGDEDSFNDNWGSAAGSLRFIAHVHENWNVFGGVTQSFRTPNLSDLTRFDTARSNEIETPVRDLDPEYFLSYEIGVKAKYHDWHFQASYFYTQIFNMIIRFPTGNIIDGDAEVTKDNDGDGYVHGVEFHGAYRFHPEWEIFMGASWLEGRVSTFPEANTQKKDEAIDRMQPLQGFIGLRWTHTSKNYWVEGVINASGGQDRLSTRDAQDTQRIPPGGSRRYLIGTIRGGAKINDNITVSASLENIGDVNYRIHGSGLNEAGINLILGVDIGL